MDMALVGEKRPATAEPAQDAPAGRGAPEINKKRLRRLRKQTPEELAVAEHKRKIEAAAHDVNAAAAIEAFEQMKALQLPINPYLHRVVINVCANDPKATGLKDAAFKVFEDLQAHLDTAKTRAEETVFSALVKICVKSSDYETCHKLLEDMREQKIEPRLRTYSSLLAAYGDEGNLEKACWVHEQLRSHELELTEAEYVALLRACVKAQDSEHFYRILSEYREMIMVPGPEAWAVFKDWFASDAASVNGCKWRCFTETISAEGVSSVTGETMESIELPQDQETALLEKVESIVRTDDKRVEQWAEFKEWLEANGPFDVILDAANIGYFNQNYSGGGFSYRQIELMLEHYEKKGKRVLIVLHKRRTYDDIVPVEFHATLKGWKDRNIMYNCRSGNNDDWYWLYAAVKLGGRTLAITNDEMRDHHFQMIHTRSLVRWKERHQVHYSIHSEKHVKVQEPPVFSTRAQHVGDSWHFPSTAAADGEWLGFQLETEQSK